MFVKTTRPCDKGHRRYWGQWTQVPAISYLWRKGEESTEPRARAALVITSFLRWTLGSGGEYIFSACEMFNSEK